MRSERPWEWEVRSQDRPPLAQRLTAWWHMWSSACVTLRGVGVVPATCEWLSHHGPLCTHATCRLCGCQARPGQGDGRTGGHQGACVASGRRQRRVSTPAVRTSTPHAQPLLRHQQPVHMTLRSSTCAQRWWTSRAMRPATTAWSGRSRCCARWVRAGRVAARTRTRAHAHTRTHTRDAHAAASRVRLQRVRQTAGAPCSTAVSSPLHRTAPCL
jgi:hypothetical protein